MFKEANEVGPYHEQEIRGSRRPDARHGRGLGRDSTAPGPCNWPAAGDARKLSQFSRGVVYL